MNAVGPEVQAYVPLVGVANETQMLINGTTTTCQVDSGSMVNTVSQSFFSTLSPTPRLLQISDTSVQGANDSSIPYVGYSVLDIAVPDGSCFCFHASSDCARHKIL